MWYIVIVFVEYVCYSIYPCIWRYINNWRKKRKSLLIGTILKIENYVCVLTIFINIVSNFFFKQKYISNFTLCEVCNKFEKKNTHTRLTNSVTYMLTLKLIIKVTIWIIETTEIIITIRKNRWPSLMTQNLHWRDPIKPTRRNPKLLMK